MIQKLLFSLALLFFVDNVMAQDIVLTPLQGNYLLCPDQNNVTISYEANICEDVEAVFVLSNQIYSGDPQIESLDEFIDDQVSYAVSPVNCNSNNIFLLGIGEISQLLLQGQSYYVLCFTRYILEPLWTYEPNVVTIYRYQVTDAGYTDECLSVECGFSVNIALPLGCDVETFTIEISLFGEANETYILHDDNENFTDEIVTDENGNAFVVYGEFPNGGTHSYSYTAWKESEPDCAKTYEEESCLICNFTLHSYINVAAVNSPDVWQIDEDPLLISIDEFETLGEVINPQGILTIIELEDFAELQDNYVMFFNPMDSDLSFEFPALSNFLDAGQISDLLNANEELNLLASMSYIDDFGCDVVSQSSFKIPINGIVCPNEIIDIQILFDDPTCDTPPNTEFICFITANEAVSIQLVNAASEVIFEFTLDEGDTIFETLPATQEYSIEMQLANSVCVYENFEITESFTNNGVEEYILSEVAQYDMNCSSQLVMEDIYCYESFAGNNEEMRFVITEGNGLNNAIWDSTDETIDLFSILNTATVTDNIFCYGLIYRNYGIENEQILMQAGPVSIAGDMLPQIELGESIVIENQSVTLEVEVADGHHIMWSTGSNNSSIQVSDPGEYWVEISIHDCAITDSVTVSFSTGIEQKVDSEIATYVKDEQLLFIDVEENITELSIYSMKGALLISNQFENNEVNIEALSPGLYVGRLELSNRTERNFRFYKP